MLRKGDGEVITRPDQTDEAKADRLYYYVRELNATIAALAKIGLVTDIDTSMHSCYGPIVQARISRPIPEVGPVTPIAIKEPA